MRDDIVITVRPQLDDHILTPHFWVHSKINAFESVAISIFERKYLSNTRLPDKICKDVDKFMSSPYRRDSNRTNWEYIISFWTHQNHSLDEDVIIYWDYSKNDVAIFAMQPNYSRLNEAI